MSAHWSDDVLTMIPGPTPVLPGVLRELSWPTVSHQFPPFVTAFRACLEDLRLIVRTRRARPFVVAGAGTLSMEMALVNLVGPDDELLVVSHGYFGDRWAELAKAFGVRHRVLSAAWGRVVPPEELARALDERVPAAVAVTHVDTSTGTAAPVADYAALLRDRESLFLLDGVCATAGLDERFDEWGLDALVTGAQKALGAPPGVAILLVSERALERRRARARVPAYYADLLRWEPIMDDPAKYFSTPAVNEVLALAEAARVVLAEGLDARFARHAAMATRLRSAVTELGFGLFTDPSCRADTLSVVTYPPGVEDAAFRADLASRGVVVAPALGPVAGKAFRVGHMGNATLDDIDRTLDALREVVTGPT